MDTGAPSPRIADDTMNLNGIKVSSAEIEEVLKFILRIREAAAIAVCSRTRAPAGWSFMPRVQMTVRLLKLTYCNRCSRRLGAN